jgi:hypothetical protein
LTEVKSVDCGFNEYIFPKYDSELQETQEKTQQESILKVLPRKGIQAPNKEAKNDYTKEYKQPPKSGLGESSRVLQDPNQNNTKIVVEIPEYHPKGDEIDYSKEREESDHSKERGESNAKRDSKAWPALEPPQKQLQKEKQQKSSQGRLIKKTVFGDTTAKMVKAMAVVHLEDREYIGAP